MERLKSFWRASVVSFCIAAISFAQTPKVKIGVSTVLSGPAATYGFDIRDSLLFANAKIAGGQYELVFEDDKCSGKDAATVAQKLINIDKVKYVIGLACSGAALAAGPLYQKAGVPTVVTCASSPRVVDVGDQIFRTTPSDRIAARKLHTHIRSKHKKIATLTESTDYCQDFKDAFDLANNGGELELVDQNFLPTDSDLRSILLKLKQASPEGIFINTQTENGFALVLKQLKQIGWDKPIYGAYWPGSPALQKIAGDQLEGIEYVDPPVLDEILNEEGKALYEEFKAKYGALRSVESVFATSYEGFRAMHEAIQTGGDVRKNLADGQFTGTFGPFSFDEQGDIVGLTFKIRKIVGGKAIAIQ